MSIKLSENVYWIGVFDWNLRNFHGIYTPKGVSYNSYLIISAGEVAVIDTVFEPFWEEFYSNLSKLTDPVKLKHIIVNHAEPDHSSSLKRLLAIAKEADVVCTAKCKEFLEKMGVSANFIVVKENGTMKIGGKTLRFVEAPMLHWPEVMWTFIEEDKILFPCDMFGTQVIESNMVAENVPDIEEHTRRYFAFIFRPLAAATVKGLDKCERLAPQMICPSHGPVWRDTAKIQAIYRKYATRPEKDQVLIIYASIWHDVEKMALALAEGVQSAGIEVVVRDVGSLDLEGWSDLLAEAMVSKGIAIGSLTVLGGPFPQMLYATMLLRLVKVKGKVGLSFGAYGWGPGVSKKLDEELKAIEAMPYRDGIEVRFNPTELDLKACRDAGRELAGKVEEVKL